MALQYEDTATFGCPKCCPGYQPNFPEENCFLPKEVRQLGITEELNNLQTNVNKIFHETGFPPYPCLIFYCIFCTPVFLACHCLQERKAKLNKLVKTFNENVGKFNMKLVGLGIIPNKMTCQILL